MPNCAIAGSGLAWPSCTPKRARCFDRAGVIECIGSDMVFDILEDAYHAFEARGLTVSGLFGMAA